VNSPREKYNNDIQYKALVDFMVKIIHECKYTPSEMREASLLASIMYEEQTIRPKFNVDQTVKQFITGE